MAVVTVTLSAAKAAALAYAAPINKMTEAVFAAVLLEQALTPYEEGLAKAGIADALKLKVAFDAAKPTDTEEAILAKAVTAEPVVDPMAEEVIK